MVLQMVLHVQPCQIRKGAGQPLKEEPWIKVAALETLFRTWRQHDWSRNRAFAVLEGEFKRYLGAEFDMRQCETLKDRAAFFNHYFKPYNLSSSAARCNFQKPGRKLEQLRLEWANTQSVPPRKSESVLEFQSLAQR